MEDSPRRAVLDTVARRVQATKLRHPARLAVDGITAAGKTTFAAELAMVLSRSASREAVHLTMDGFHHPRAVRHRRGRTSAEGYYEDAYDFDAFVARVLRPLGPGGGGVYTERIIDLATDAPVAEKPHTMPPDGVLVVDGSFLQRPETAGQWDLVVWLDVPFATARARGVLRDAAAFGGADEAGRLYDLRYHAAARRYLRECDPVARADIVVDNTDPQSPMIARI